MLMKYAIPKPPLREWAELTYMYFLFLHLKNIHTMIKKLLPIKLHYIWLCGDILKSSNKIKSPGVVS